MVSPRVDGVKQAWRFVGAGFILVAIGMLGLIAGLRFSGTAQDAKVASLHEQVTSNRARIRQLEDDYRRRNIPIPTPTTTTSPTATSTTRTPAHHTATKPRATTTSTSTTTSTTTGPAPASTTTTTRPPVCVNRSRVGVCIGGSP